MFEIAIEKKYDWFLALDADTILSPDWLTTIANNINQYGSDDLFVFGHSVKDKFLDIIDRGNHCYNGKYSSQALKVVKKSINTSLKPEGSIKNNIKNIHVRRFHKQIIGYHGYEQYYKDIYYRFWNRHRRKPSKELINLIKNRLNANYKTDKDCRVGLMGWNSYNFTDYFLASFFPKISHYSATQKKHDRIRNKLFKKNILEKKSLKISYEDFIKSFLN